MNYTVFLKYRTFYRALFYYIQSKDEKVYVTTGLCTLCVE